MCAETNNANLIILKMAKSGDSFVGINISEEKKEITFPMGFTPVSEKISAGKIDKVLRTQILSLIASISYCNKKLEGTISFINERAASNNLPVSPAMYIIQDYLERNSYYTEKESAYTHACGGKINWHRTIKSVDPVISKNGIAYLEFAVRKNHIQDRLLITELHKYCVFKAFELLGFLFTSDVPEKGLLQESDIARAKEYYISFIEEKIDSIHLESNIELLTNMVEFLKNYDNDCGVDHFVYGTTSYQTVWESLIEKYFSSISQSIKEKYFYPASKWSFEANSQSPLRPDTIMFYEDTSFILDAKYYSYAVASGHETSDENSGGQDGTIPGTDSIQKQITYAEYIDNSIENNSFSSRIKYRFAPQNIYNVFILPGSHASSPFEYRGFAMAEWKDNRKNYHRVHAVVLDTEFLLSHWNKNSAAAKNELVSLIKAQC